MAKAWAVDKCYSTNVAPVVVAGQNRAEVGPAGHGKHVVRHKVLAKAKEYCARLARGIAMTDADRVHCFVMGELFKRQVVLLYRPHNRPGGLSLVLASPWSLERGKTDGRHFVTFDAKHDTQESGQLRWSSFRCTSGEDHGHVGVPISVQVAGRENEDKACLPWACC